MANPLAPTLTSPSHRGYVDTTPDLAWTFNHPDPGSAQAQVAIKVRQLAPTPGSDQWWNGAAFTGVETYIALTDEFDTISAALTAGATYQWSVSTKDGSGNTSPYSTTSVFTAIAAPVGTCVSPTTSPNVTTSRPTFTWQYSQAQGLQQSKYRIAVYDSATVPVDPFDPTTSEALALLFDTGWVEDSDAWSHVSPVDLDDGVTYDWYLKVEAAGGMQSAVDTEEFTAALSLPGAPVVNAVARNDLGVVRLECEVSFNLFTYEGSAFEVVGDVGEWIAGDRTGGGANECTLAQSTPVGDVEAPGGVGALKVTPIGGTYAYVDTQHTTYAAWTSSKSTYQLAMEQRPQTYVDISSDVKAVNPSTDYTFLISAIRNGADDHVTVRIHWYTDAMAFISTSAATAELVGTAGGYEALSVTATAPVNAAFAVLNVRMDAPDNIEYYFDNALFAADDDPSWSAGGDNANGGFVVERSADGGLTWSEILGYSFDNPGLSHNPAIVYANIDDRTAPLANVEKLQYRVYGVVFDSNGDASFTPPTEVIVPQYLPGDSWWLRDPLDPSRDMEIAQIDFSKSFHVDAEEFRPVGRTYSVVVQSNTPRSEMFYINCYVETEEDIEKIERMLRSDRTLIIQSNTAGQVWFIRVSGMVTSTQTRAVSQMSHRKWRPVFRVNAQVVEVKPIQVSYTVDYDSGELTYSEVTS